MSSHRSLTGLNLNGFIDDEIQNLRGLTNLDLRNNRLTGSLRDSLFQPQIVTLRLATNLLGPRLGDAVGNAAALRTLELQSNLINEVSSSLTQLTLMTYL